MLPPPSTFLLMSVRVWGGEREQGELVAECGYHISLHHSLLCSHLHSGPCWAIHGLLHPPPLILSLPSCWFSVHGFSVL